MSQSLYLCIWPDLSFTFVQARSKTQAFNELDRVATADPAWITKYDGSFLITFIWDLEETDGEAPSAVGILEGEQRSEMLDEVMKRGLPNLWDYFHEAYKTGEYSLEAAREAMTQDKERFPTKGKDPEGYRERIEEMMENLYGHVRERSS